MNNINSPGKTRRIYFAKSLEAVVYCLMTAMTPVRQYIKDPENQGVLPVDCKKPCEAIQTGSWEAVVYCLMTAMDPVRQYKRDHGKLWCIA